MMAEFPCAVCAVDCSNDQAIHCSNCRNWVHPSCTNLSEQDLKSWSAKNLKFVCKSCSYCGLNYDAGAALSRLAASLSAKSMTSITNQAKSELKLIQTYNVSLPIKDGIVHSSTEIDQQSVAILETFQPYALNVVRPLKTYGDGNCLYRAASLALTGTEQKHELVRLLTSIELILNRNSYDTKQAENDFLNDVRIVTSQYTKLVQDCVKIGSYSEMGHMYALSEALGISVKSCYPPTFDQYAEAYTRTLKGPTVKDSHPKLTVLWTMMSDREISNFQPNHFVPLVKLENVMDIQAVDPNLLDLSSVHGDDDSLASGAHGDSVVVLPETESSLLLDQSSLDDSCSQPMHESTCVSEAGVVAPFSDIPSNMHGELNSGLLDTEPLIGILLSVQTGLRGIPKGLKENHYFVLDNTGNTSKRENNQRSYFGDDCGIWDTKKGTTPKSYYHRSETGHLTYLFFRQDQFCTKKQVKGKRGFVPVNPQPDPDQVIVVHRYYTSLKLDPSYKKRVTWLGGGGIQSSLAVVEYLGKFPGLAPHSNSKDPKSEYLRTPDYVLEEVKSNTGHDKPRQLYDKLKSKYDELTRPSVMQQIHDALSRKKRKENCELGHPTNVADQFQTIDSLVSQGHPFVRSVIRVSARPPVVILYTDEQLSDLRNLCLTGRTFLNVDKTFMLCKMHVTVTCYKQLSVTRRKTGEPPLFFGPMFIHDHSDFETYSQFFNHLKVKFDDLQHDKLVIGTDDEKALVKAIEHSFPNATHVLCTRHLKENTRQKLTDDAVTLQDKTKILERIFGADGIVSADDTICFDQKCDEFVSECSEISETFLQYFQKRLKPSLKEKVTDPVRRDAIPPNWTNNNCESLNHVLKQTVDWTSQPFTKFIELTHDLVIGQFKELRSSLVGTGEYRLAESYKHYQKSKTVWSTMSLSQREALYLKFRKHVPRDRSVATSTDGQCTVVVPRTNGRKPGTRKRPVNVRTTTFKRPRPADDSD